MSAAQKKQRNAARHDESVQLTGWWLRRMLAVEQPFGEKATFVWHSHFATSLKKVKIASLMLQHNERQRGLATSRFDTLAYTMLLDAATQRWLDNVRNTVTGPNENLSREFMEVFTLGHADGYTEHDVRDGARALTGYKVDPHDGTVSLRPALHDTGAKTVFGHTGDFDAKGFCDAVLARPGCARYVVARLFGRLVSDRAADDATQDRLLAAYGPRRDLAELLVAMFTDHAFDDARDTFVVGPVEWLIGAMRALGVTADSDAELRQTTATLDALGQLPFFPPSVGGWPSGAVWLSTAAADLRFRAAGRLVQHADLDDLTGSPTARVEAIAYRLGIATWSDRTLAVLRGTAGDVRQLAAVALNSPEYLVH